MPSTPLTSTYTRSAGLNDGTGDDSNITDELNVTDTSTDSVLMDLTKTGGLDVNVPAYLKPSLSVTTDTEWILQANNTGVAVYKDFTVNDGWNTKFSVNKSTGAVRADGKIVHERAATSAGDVADVYIKRIAQYTGGSGDYNCAHRIDHYTQSNGTNAECGSLIYHASTAPTGQHFGSTVIMDKKPTGGECVGSQIQCLDFLPNTSSITYGLDLQMKCSGTDNSGRRTGLNILAGDPSFGNTVSEIDAAIGVTSIGTNSLIKKGLALRGRAQIGIDTTGINFTEALIKAKAGHTIRFNEANKDLFYDSVNERLAYHSVAASTDRAFWFNDNGNFTINKGGAGLFPISYTGVASTGVASVSFGGGNKPGTSQVNPHMWVDIVINGVECCFPVWRKV